MLGRLWSLRNWFWKVAKSSHACTSCGFSRVRRLKSVVRLRPGIKYQKSITSKHSHEPDEFVPAMSGGTVWSAFDIPDRYPRSQTSGHDEGQLRASDMVGPRYRTSK
eukprot:1179640-Rhodomonas_salina.3